MHGALPGHDVEDKVPYIASLFDAILGAGWWLVIIFGLFIHMLVESLVNAQVMSRWQGGRPFRPFLFLPLSLHSQGDGTVACQKEISVVGSPRLLLLVHQSGDVGWSVALQLLYLHMV